MLALAAAALLAACGGGGDSGSRLLQSQAIVAAAGGTVTTPGGEVVITVPAGALDRNANVLVRRENTAPALGDRLVPNGSVFSISFDGGATLTQPVTISVAAAAAPTHPVLGEVAFLEDGAWARAPSSFFRRADRRIVVLTDEAVTLRPVLRTLQASSGEAVERGRTVFLSETFGNESFFGDTLGLHTLLNGLTPAQAVGAGVQVDLARVPAPIVAVLTGDDLAAKDAALADPAVTRALLKADAVVGVRTFYDDPASDVASRAGITCALCHVAVQPTTFQLSGGPAALPVGALRLDGQPNLAMDAGAILSLTPFAQSQPGVPALLQGWGPGRFDVRALPDNPLEDGVDNPTSTPPLWNFVDLAEQDYLYNWDGLFRNTTQPGNALASQAEAVFDLVMHANGAFGTASGSVAPELSIEPPQALLDALSAAETAEPGNVIGAGALQDVQAWQRSHVSPAPGAYDETLAERGFLLFNDREKGNCSGCHRSAEFTGPVVTGRITLATPAGGLAGGIKTPGLRGIAATAPYFHDGSAATLRGVMDVYAGRITPALTNDEKDAIVEYLKSL